MFELSLSDKQNFLHIIFAFITPSVTKLSMEWKVVIVLDFESDIFEPTPDTSTHVKHSYYKALTQYVCVCRLFSSSSSSHRITLTLNVNVMRCDDATDIVGHDHKYEYENRLCPRINAYMVKCVIYHALWVTSFYIMCAFKEHDQFNFSKLNSTCCEYLNELRRHETFLSSDRTFLAVVCICTHMFS